MKRKLTILGAGAGIIIIGLIIQQLFIGMKEPPEPKKEYSPLKYVKTQKAEFHNYTAEITAFGRLSAKDKIDVYSEVPGNLEQSSPPFKVGVTFKKGQKMLEIDSREARLNLNAQKSSFLSALTRMMSDMKSEFPASYPDWNGFLEKFEIDEPLPELPGHKSAKEKYFLASRQIFNLYYQIKNLELRYSKYSIEAPFDGAVTQSFAEAGMLVNPGQKLGSFAGIADYELELAVNKDDIGFIRAGSPAIISNENSSRTWSGKITRIAKNIDPQTQTVKVFLNARGGGLSGGLYLKASIRGSEIKNVFRLPRKALAGEDEVYFVKNGALDKTKVKIFRISEKFVYVRGVDEGMEIIVESLADTPLGTKVETYSNRED